MPRSKRIRSSRGPATGKANRDIDSAVTGSTLISCPGAPTGPRQSIRWLRKTPLSRRRRRLLPGRAFLRAVPRLGRGRRPSHEIVAEHRPAGHLVVLVLVIQRPPAVPRRHRELPGALVGPEPGPPAFPVLAVPFLPLALQADRASRLSDVV